MTTGGNYFELFDLPQIFEIDLAALDAAYERLSMAHHPDFFSTAGPAEQARAERISADLNEGYRVLSAEDGRAAYLLGLLSAGHNLDSNRLPEGFLQDMFMLQEEVDDLESDATEAARQPLKAQVEARLSKIRGEAAGLFARLEAEAAQEDSQAAMQEVLQPVLQDVQTHLNCAKYLERLLARLQ
jgi:molecular chaperone HscB